MQFFIIQLTAFSPAFTYYDGGAGIQLVGVGTAPVKEKRFAKQRVAGAQLVGVATTSVKEKRFAKQESLVFSLCESELPQLQRKGLQSKSSAERISTCQKGVLYCIASSTTIEANDSEQRHATFDLLEL